jgi:uncharacterized protein (DUF2345 family)
MSRPNTLSRTVNSAGPPKAGGPYEAIIVNHLDPYNMGTLEVELLKNGSGNNPERTGQLVTCKYLSPFYGVTPSMGTTANDGYEYTQKSYGFWAVPPDVGTKVLVMFVEDNTNYAYWIGCIQDENMNFMVPDGRASTDLTTPNTPQDLQGIKLPVGEYNKKTETGTGKDPTRFVKPYNKDFSQILQIQGLISDETRGTTTTSARREVPSGVFGMSTPGPTDKRPGAPTLDTGSEQNKTNYYASRLGGSSIVMDDGDDKLLRKGHAEEAPPFYASLEAGEAGGDETIPHNELLRFRTRTGHQILLHNSEDLIYIANSRGTAWIEITSDGKIDIHSQDSISVNSENDLNFTAFRDFNVEAGRNINMKASARYANFANKDGRGNEAGRVQIESKHAFNLDVGTESKITVGASHQLLVGSAIKAEAGAAVNIKSAGATNIDSDAAVNVISTAAMNLQAGANVNITSASSTLVSSGSNISLAAPGILSGDAGEVHWNSGLSGSASAAGPAETPEPVVRLPLISLPQITPGVSVPGTYQSILARSPQHEPWPHHENQNPQSFKLEETDREQVGQLIDGRPAQTPDTFRKNTNQQVSSLNPAISSFSNSSAGGFSLSAGGDPLDPTVDRTLDSALQQPGTLAAPVLSASEVPGTITGFSRSETANYMSAIGQRESGNKYDVVNTIGYSGKYQFGSLACQEAGYIILGSSGNNRTLNNPAAWTGKDGVNNKQDWLTNVGNCQEKAMIAYTNKNYIYLTNNGGIRSGDANDKKAGMLAGAHLLGAAAMKNWRNGQRGQADAYGTKPDEYYVLGARSVGGSGNTATV